MGRVARRFRDVVDFGRVARCYISEVSRKRGVLRSSTRLVEPHVEETASPRRHPGWRLRWPGGGPGAERSGSPRHARRQEQPSPVPAPALPGGDRGARRPGCLRADPPAALAPAKRHRPHGSRPAHRGGEEAHPLREPSPRLRLPRRGDRDDSRLFRKRQVGGPRARPQDRGRCARHPPAHSARLRVGRARDHGRGPAGLDHVRRDRRRSDRRRAGRRAGGDRRADAGT